MQGRISESRACANIQTIKTDPQMKVHHNARLTAPNLNPTMDIFLSFLGPDQMRGGMARVNPGGSSERLGL